MQIQSKISHPLQPSASAKNRHLWMRTEIYSSGGCRYCRFRWGKGKDSWGYVHINGGSASTELVRARRKQIDEAIATHQPLPNIIALISEWEGARRGRKPKLDESGG